MTTTPAGPAPAAPTVPAPAAHPHGFAGWLAEHVFPEVKALEADAAKARALLPQAEQGAAKLVGVAQTLEALISTADPVLGTQIGASAAVLREIAEGLAAAARAL